MVQTVRLPPAVADWVCQMALRRHQSVYAFLGGLIMRIHEKQTLHPADPACYGAQSSTLSGVLSDSTTRRSSRPAAPSSPR